MLRSLIIIIRNETHNHKVTAVYVSPNEWNAPSSNLDKTNHFSFSPWMKTLMSSFELSLRSTFTIFEGVFSGLKLAEKFSLSSTSWQSSTAVLVLLKCWLKSEEFNKSKERYRFSSCGTWIDLIMTLFFFY